MIRPYWAGILFLFLMFGSFALAQDDDLQLKVDDRVSKIQKQLDLTDTQAEAVKPIIKDYMAKREEILQEVSTEGIVDHVAVKRTLRGLKENEYLKLSAILSKAQMKKLIDKDNLMAALNPDSAESNVDDDGNFTLDGANFKF